MEHFSTEDMKQFNYLSFEIDSAYHEAATRMGLSDSAMLILYAICNGGGECPVSDITRLSGVSKQTINSALRRLEEEGIVQLESSAGRRKKVCLTQAGELSAQRTVLRMIKIENDIFGGWTKEERDLYLDLTLRYLTQFKEKVEEEL